MWFSGEGPGLCTAGSERGQGIRPVKTGSESGQHAGLLYNRFRKSMRALDLWATGSESGYGAKLMYNRFREQIAYWKCTTDTRSELHNHHW